MTSLPLQAQVSVKLNGGMKHVMLWPCCQKLKSRGSARFNISFVMEGDLYPTLFSEEKACNCNHGESNEEAMEPKFVLSRK